MNNGLSEYVSLVEDEKLKQLCFKIIEVSEEQLRQPSSSSGMYHPQDEICEYGQVKHIKKVVNLILWAVCRHDVKKYDLDILITIALLHDLPKKFNFEAIVEEQDFIHSGKSIMNKNHGYDNAICIDAVAKELNIDEDIRSVILNAIAGHMGKWIPKDTEIYDDFYLNGEYEFDRYGELIQQADYFASRKNIIVNYDLEETKKLLLELKKCQ